MMKLLAGLVLGLVGGAAVASFVMYDSTGSGAVANTAATPRVVAPRIENDGAEENAKLRRALADVQAEMDRLKTENVRLLSTNSNLNATVAEARNRVAEVSNRSAASGITSSSMNFKDSPVAEDTAAKAALAATLKSKVANALAVNDKATALAAIDEFKKAGPGNEAAYMEALKAILAVGTPNMWGNRPENGNVNTLGLSWEEYTRLMTREMRDHILLGGTDAGATPQLIRMAGQLASWDNYITTEERNKLVTAMLDVAPDKATQLSALRAMRGVSEPDALRRVSGMAINGGLDAEVRAAAVDSLSRQAMTDDTVYETLRSLENDSDARVSTAARRAVITAKPPVTGYLVSEVTDQGQAKSAGFLVGDIIVVYNGREVKDENLRVLQNSIPEGQKGEVQVHRAGQIVKLLVNRGMLGIDGSFVQRR